MQFQNNKCINRVIITAIFSSIAIIISYIETFINIPVIFPGFKLGLANIVVIVALYKLSFRYAFIINIIRILIIGILFGSMYSLIYSISGGVASVILMYLVLKTDKFSQIGIAIIGSNIHNLVQVLVAVILLQNSMILSYLPILILIGTVMGFIVGVISKIIIRRIDDRVS